jgi:hypothetical protein
MPARVKAASNGTIPMGEVYSVGVLAKIMQISGTTVRAMIDQGLLSGYWKPGRKPQRCVRHEALVRFVRIHPQFRHCLDRLEGIEPIELPEGTRARPEPAPPPVRAQVPPRSPERPRRARYGKIPASRFYTLQETGFVLGVCRRSVWEWVRSGRIQGIRLPAPPQTQGIHRWRWAISHQELVNFVQNNPHLAFALRRIGNEPAAHSRTPR